MRQYIIKNQPNSPVSDSSITLKVGSGDYPSMRLAPGVSLLNLPLRLEFMHPNDEASMHFQYRLPKELMDKGVMLMGAYKEGDVVSFGLFNTGTSDIRLKEMQSMLLIDVTEKASLKAVANFPNEIQALAPKPKKVTARRGRRA